ncbi:hypothetical protein [Algoriphagus antarcticus]|uniref:Uncharacterized protein n=1 Tax=Algoriphagus antarcticus TaxID=238540 RepID=A0A3E0E8L5_9BACT|nr:hypothetical protein [Algoriphagus antarcticus]REG94588.1 hypothetical protein C8N25_101421 [Algoriphagus antarcticus]
MKGFVVSGIACLMMLWAGSVSGQVEEEKLVFRNLDESLGLSNSNILSMIWGFFVLMDLLMKFRPIRKTRADFG